MKGNATAQLKRPVHSKEIASQKAWFPVQRDQWFRQRPHK